MATKRCRMCHHYKEVGEQFHKDGSSRDGWQTNCKSCHRKMREERKSRKEAKAMENTTQAPQEPKKQVDIGGGIDINPILPPGGDIGGGVEVVIPFAPNPDANSGDSGDSGDNDKVEEPVIDSLPPRPQKVQAAHRVYGAHLPMGVTVGMKQPEVHQILETDRAKQAAAIHGAEYHHALEDMVGILNAHTSAPIEAAELGAEELRPLPNPLNPFDDSELTMDQAIAVLRGQLHLNEHALAASAPPPTPELAAAVTKFISHQDQLAATKAQIDAEREAKLLEIQTRSQALLEATKDQAGRGALIDLNHPVHPYLDKGGFPIPTQESVAHVAARGVDPKPTVPKRQGFIKNIRSFDYTPTSGPKIFGKIKIAKKVIK